MSALAHVAGDVLVWVLAIWLIGGLAFVVIGGAVGVIRRIYPWVLAAVGIGILVCCLAVMVSTPTDRMITAAIIVIYWLGWEIETLKKKVEELERRS